MIAVVGAAISIAGQVNAQSPMVKGMVAGCLDRMEKQSAAPITRDDKKYFLNFCYCRAAGVSALATDEKAVQRILTQEPTMTAAIGRIESGCHDGVRAGRRFYP